MTTVLNIELEVSAVEGAEVRVFAEKPLVKRDATNTRRVVSSDVIETLPLRSVDNIVGLQTGVVDNHIRGGRSGDNAYYVDGVLMKDHWGGSNATGSLSQTGMEEISLEAGGFGAEYGGANGGIINVTSKSGGQQLAASVETVRDLGETTAGTNQDKIYSYGYSLNNFEVGGPVSDRFRYWLMVEQENRDDKSPSYGSHPYGEISQYQTLKPSDSSAIWNSDGELLDNLFYYDEIIFIFFYVF